MYMRKLALSSLLNASSPLQLGLSIADRDSLANLLLRKVESNLLRLFRILQYPRRIELQSRDGFRWCEERRLCEVSRRNLLNLRNRRRLIWRDRLSSQL